MSGSADKAEQSRGFAFAIPLCHFARSAVMFLRSHYAQLWGFVTPTKVVGTTKTYRLDLMVGELGLCPGLPAKNPRTVFRRFTNSPIKGSSSSHLAVGAPQALTSRGNAAWNYGL